MRWWKAEWGEAHLLLVLLELGDQGPAGESGRGMPRGGGDGSLDGELVGMRMPFTEHLLCATVNPPNSPVSNKNMETRRDKVA